MDKDFDLEDFAILKSVRKKKYKVNAPHVVAYRQMPVGSTVTFIYSKSGPKPLALSKKEEIDRHKYLDILERSRKSLVNFAGV